MTLTAKATVVVNLIRMGYSGEHAKHIADQWRLYQRDYSLQSITADGSNPLPIFSAGMPDDVGGQFFLSCHYGSYPPHRRHAG